MQTPKRVHVIACAVLALDLKAVAGRLGIDVSTELLPGGLHNTPNELRRRLQEAIDKASAERRADMIAVGYGVCGLGTVGIHARNIPLAIPRVHDCIALFLGSDAAYKEQFAKYPGTYYISAGWVEEKAQPQDEPECAPEDRRPTVLEPDDLIERYGEENAEAIRYFLRSWQRNYQRAAFIDTGVAGRRRYADVARAMAQEFGWEYEELPGTGELLAKLLTTRTSTDEVLVVPPHHVTAYDALSKGLTTVPIWQSAKADPDRTRMLVFQEEAEGAPIEPDRQVRHGLGIDAGGTYTDVVVYDFRDHDVIQKAKALTTKWDFTVGIERALDQLDPDVLARVDLVSISTTLATNAIVEGKGQAVGLLIMPPYGLFDAQDIAHRPLAVIDGKTEIDGTELAPINPEQVRQLVRDMIQRHGVLAFAVTGFASHRNPSHELQVKAIVQAQTGLSVTCGHEVSELINYRVRAQTAALNASIIPFLDSLLKEVRVSLQRRGIQAPVMVVKSDGSLMSVQMAHQRPIETILSGPAASVAGARYLARLANTIVVDMGGTTTDTATIKDGIVRTCDEGANVGGQKTHVRALQMRTLGLGGDSIIAYEKGRLQVGPQRVAPVSWLAAHHADGGRALDWLERHLDEFGTSTRPMDLIVRDGRAAERSLDDDEQRVLDLLSERPHSVHELACKVRGEAWRAVPLERLESAYLVQRCGLTPTDALHATGQLALWDPEAAGRMCDLFSRLIGMKREEFAQRMLRQVVNNLAVELLKKQLDEQTDADGMDESAVAMALIGNLLEGGGRGFRVRVQLDRPVIGIGAPVHYFLPEAALLLETDAVIPPDADVANAIGAITSSVLVHKQVRISPNEAGAYVLHGLPDPPTFVNFGEANDFAVEQLRKTVREMARAAGTSQTRVEIAVEDHIAPASDGAQLFIGRTLEARLSGRPDIARLAAL